jgi:hypothetical protein
MISSRPGEAHANGDVPDCRIDDRLHTILSQCPDYSEGVTDVGVHETGARRVAGVTACDRDPLDDEFERSNVSSHKSVSTATEGPRDHARFLSLRRAPDDGRASPLA